MPDQSSADRRFWLCALGISLALATGCATMSGTGSGRDRLGPARGRARGGRQDYDLAVVEYTKAVRANPDDNEARIALDRARLRASQEHYFRGRPLAGAERLRRGARRVPARLRAEPERCRRRRGPARHAPEAAHEGRRVARRQDRAAVAHRTLAIAPAARDSTCRRRQAPRFARLQHRPAAGWCSCARSPSSRT